MVTVWNRYKSKACNIAPASVVFAALLLSPMGCTHADRKAPAERPAEKVELVEQYWPNGKLRLRKEVLSRPDGTLVEHGRYTRWHDNGLKEYETVFVQGKKHGTATRWHKNGQKWIEEHYVHGQRHGVSYTWDETGVKRGEVHHLYGKPAGTWTTWDAKGKIKSQQRFEADPPQL